MKMFCALVCAAFCSLAIQAQTSGADSAAASLPEVKRVYVAELVGTEAPTLRELIIASLESTKLFVLTENADRADAILKGAADDHVFTDTHDIEEGISTRQNGGKSSSSGTTLRSGGIYGGLAISDNQFHHSRERKHEAYATVRLCSTNGDVLWSTTQESQGAKFKGAGADVAAKVARQLTLDMEKARRGMAPGTGSQ